jgi:hypothetical protein
MGFSNEMIIHGECNVKLVVYEMKWLSHGNSLGERIITPYFFSYDYFEILLLKNDFYKIIIWFLKL